MLILAITQLLHVATEVVVLAQGLGGPRQDRRMLGHGITALLMSGKWILLKAQVKPWLA